MPIFDAHLEMFSWRPDSSQSLEGYLKTTDPHVQQKEVNLTLLKRAGVRAGFFCINTALAGESDLDDALYQASCYREFVNKNKDDAALILSKEEFKQAMDSDKIGLMLYLENINNIDEELKNFRVLYSAGVRLIGLVWDRPSRIGGNHLEGTYGLSAVGKKLIEAMNEKGVIVDLAHTNERTFFEVLEATKKPPVVSHAGCRDVANLSRNISNEQLKAIAQKGGVVGIFLVPEYLNSEGLRKTHSVWYEHVKCAFKYAGSDSVGLGSDFGGMLGHTFEDLSNAGQLSKLYRGLKKHGFTDKEARKILFDNFARLSREVLPEK